MITILMIDDDPATKTIIDGWTTDANISGAYRFLHTESDKEALKVINENQRIDIVFVNIDSGALTGLDLFHKVENRETRFPRIAISDGKDLQHIRKAIADGAVEFIVKPLDRDDLFDVIDRVYAQVERRRKNWKDRAEYVALRREVTAAAEMQSSFLPKSFPEFKNLDVFARTRPARDVGGDFFDVIALDDDRVMVLVADVAGKSVPAAFYMAISRTLLHTLIIQEASPCECLELANDALCGYDIPSMFVSVICVLVDTSARTICYSDGGHLPILLNHPGQAGANQIGESGGPVLGVVPGAAYEEATVSLEKGDSILLYSDGISEAFNENHEQFGLERLISCFAGHADQAVENVAEAVFRGVDNFTGNAEQSDDVTVLCMKMR